MNWKLIVATALVAVIVMPALAQENPRRRPGRRGGGAPAAERQRDRGPERESGAIKPYDEVITDEATTDPGLFLVAPPQGEDLLRAARPRRSGARCCG